MRASLAKHFDLLDTRFTPSDNALTIRELYLAVLLRWPALYPVDVDRSWFDLARWPNLHSLAERIEMRDSVQAAACAEGLGSKPFSNPQPASPPEGSAL